MNFTSLTNTHLISSFKCLVHSERKITSEVLQFISEIDKRKIFLESGYSSLFDFLVKEFGYSPGAAMRRIDGARLLNELPEMGEKLKSGTITLSQATQIQRASREVKKLKNNYVTISEKRKLLLSIENASQKESEATIAAALDLPIVPVQKETLHKNQSVTMTITFTHEQMQTLEQAQNMTAHCAPSKNWADTITYLAKKEISRRIGTNTSARISTSTSPSTYHHTSASTSTGIRTIATSSTARTRKSTAAAAAVKEKVVSTYPSECRNTVSRRAIPLPVRKKLLNPYACCEFVSASGKRCSSRRFLQIDHINSWSTGGSNKLENLQVLCGVHNRWKYFTERYRRT